MAVIESWFNQELNEAVKVRHLNGELFSNDNQGNLIGVKLWNNGQAVALTGSVMGYCILSDGVSIPVAGQIVGNSAFIYIPTEAYSVPGPINIIIKNINSTIITTLLAVVTNVIGTGNVVADPSQSTIDAWSAQISATLAALEAGAVRFDAAQSLTDSQKAQARNNMGAKGTATLISGSDYRITFP